MGHADGRNVSNTRTDQMERDCQYRINVLIGNRPLDFTTAGKTTCVLSLFDVTTTDTDWKEVGTALTEWTRTVRRHLDMEDDDNDE